MSNPVLVIVEITSVNDPQGMAEYAKRASALMGNHGGKLLAQGGVSVEDEQSFETLVVQRWRSEEAFLTWQDSEDYRPLKTLRLASATLRVAIMPVEAGVRGNT